VSGGAAPAGRPAFLAADRPARVLVKICGVRRAEDVEAALASGADAIGFNFWPGSRRHIGPTLAAPLIARLPPHVAAVGVMVNATRAEILAAVSTSGAAAVQLHGDEPPDLCRDLPVPVLKALRVASPADLVPAAAFAAAGVTAFLLDTPSAGFGGSGSSFDWTLARGAVLGGLRVALAGGLHPGNVAAAVRAVRPWAVDVASGVESSPGVKDPVLLRSFVAAVHAASEAPPDDP
jgi:phosphoribosylanthranilate isomerase